MQITFNFSQSDYRIFEDIASMMNESVEDYVKRVLRISIKQTKPMVALYRLVQSTKDLHTALMATNDEEGMEVDTLALMEPLQRNMLEFTSTEFAETVNGLRNHYNGILSSLPGLIENLNELLNDQKILDEQKSKGGSNEKTNPDESTKTKKNFFEDTDEENQGGETTASK